MFSNKNVSLLLHVLVFLAGNAAVVAFVPEQYKELVSILGNALVSLSAFYDRTHAIAQGYHQ